MTKTSTISKVSIETQMKPQKKPVFNFISHFTLIFLVHIFFDDAFKPRILNGKPRKSRFVNEYVKLLEECVPKTAKYVHVYHI